MTRQEDPEVGGGLLVDLDQAKKVPKSAATVTAQWFSQDLFAGVEEDKDGEEGGAKESHAVRVSASSPAGSSELLVPNQGPSPAAEKVGYLLLPSCPGALGNASAHSGSAEVRSCG